MARAQRFEDIELHIDRCVVVAATYGAVCIVYVEKGFTNNGFCRAGFVPEFLYGTVGPLEKELSGLEGYIVCRCHPS